MSKYFKDKHFVSLVSLTLFAVTSIWCAIRGEFLFAALFGALSIPTIVVMRREENKKS